LAAPLAHAQGDDAAADKAADKPADQTGAAGEAGAETRAEPAKAEAKLSTNVSLAAPSQEPASDKAAPPGEALTFKTNGWSFGVYGFAALNVMHDSTQSFGPAAGNTVLSRVGTFKGNNDQLQITARDSRFGFKIGAPEMSGIKASAVMEADFSGTQPTEASEQTSNVQNPLRMRHYYVKAETPVVDVLAGQYHDLFGWGGKGFYPSTVAFLGITGQVYHRQAQLRVSKTFATDAVDIEVAAAAARGVQRASGLPDAEAGLRFAINGWKGIGQQGYGQPGLSPLQLGVSGIGRRFEVAQFVEFPGGSNKVNGYGVAANVFLPVVPAPSVDDRSNALSLTGEFSTGSGIADMYNSDLTGGVLFPTLPNPEGRGVDPAKPPPVWAGNIDSGIVTYDGNGKVQPVKWQAFVVGLQYYLPVMSGKIWVSGNFSQLKSSNAVKLTPIAGQSAVYKQARYVDGNLFIALTSSLQVGYSFQMVEQTFADDVKARNYRNEGALHFFF
jgi:hypothetical protein